MTARAILSADRQTFTLSTGRWKAKFPISQLDGQIRMYQDLAARPSRLYGSGHYRSAYQPVIDALTRMKAKFEGNST